MAAALGVAALTSNPQNAAAQANEATPSSAAGSAQIPPQPPAYAAWRGSAHAPPPAIALGAPPAPELAPLEYARRPFELVPEFALGVANCSDGTQDDTRCDGLGAGAGFGLSALWRASPYFAFGGTLNALGFGFHPGERAHLRDTSASGLFYGLLGRVYFSDHGTVEPYLELGLGGGAARTNARESDDLNYAETTLGGAVRVGGALEFYLSRHLRLGPAFDWTRLRVSRLERCAAGNACVDLDPSATGHGVGFSTLSVRLSILLGPGL